MEGNIDEGTQNHEEEDCLLRPEIFSLYETRSRFYVIGMDTKRSCCRVLKIDKSDPCELNIWEDDTLYSPKECKDLLNRLKEGNMSTGGLRFVTTFYGIIGFVQFLGPYYMILVTERKMIGSICDHDVYAVAKSTMIAIANSSDDTVPSDMVKSERRYKTLFCEVDLSKDFFYCYSYHIMSSLQNNLFDSKSGDDMSAYDSMFVWNSFLTRGIRNILHNTIWTVALVHGFFKQVRLATSRKEFKLTLIARRSRHYAGTRYLKRGVNENGRVANDVETEQIVSEDAPGVSSVQVTSVVQNRGSIPLYWSQEASRLVIKPDIILQRKDPNYEATRLHFKNLARRYGNPIIIFDLIKKRETKPRESILQKEFAKAINTINEDLSGESRLKFVHWDLNELSTRKDMNVLLLLTQVSAHALNMTKFFYCEIIPSLRPQDHLTLPVLERQNDKEGSREDDASNGMPKQHKLQKGVLRTNCIDCLDRTNIAQFGYGLVALGHQLQALDVIDVPNIDMDAPLAKILMKLYEEMGDKLALQYGGSGALNTIFSKHRGQWQAAAQSQKFLRNLQRYYSNAYMDALKQDAINVFLGYFQPQRHKPAPWELESDKHFEIGRLSSFSDEISRSPIRRSHSVGDVLHEDDDISALANSLIYKMVNLEPPKKMPQDDVERIHIRNLESSLSNSKTSESSDLRYFPGGHRQFLTDYDQFCVNGPNFTDLYWLAYLGNSDEIETIRRSSFPELPTGSPIAAKNTIHGVNGMMPTTQQNGFSSNGGEINMEMQHDAPLKDFLNWIDNGGALFR